MTDTEVPSQLRRLVVERAGNCCEYCRYPGLYSAQTLSIDHIVPRRAGGATVESNLALSCQGCNGHKATRTMATDPVTGAAVPLFNPRSERWQDHFTWSEGFLEIAGLTPVGRASVEALQLNREGLVNTRQVLYVVGRHPPLEDEG